MQHEQLPTCMCICVYVCREWRFANVRQTSGQQPFSTTLFCGEHPPAAHGCVSCKQSKKSPSGLGLGPRRARAGGFWPSITLVAVMSPRGGVGSAGGEGMQARMISEMGDAGVDSSSLGRRFYIGRSDVRGGWQAAGWMFTRGIGAGAADLSSGDSLPCAGAGEV